jgi:hypothetical protein
VRSYTETLKGLWNRINKEIESAEAVMVQVLRNAKFDGSSQFNSAETLTPDEVKAAHKTQKQLIMEVFSLVESTDPDHLLKNNAAITDRVNSLISRHKSIVQDSNVGRCFSRIVPGLEAEFTYNQETFQEMGNDLLQTMKKFCVLYTDLDLVALRNKLLKLNSVEAQTAIENLVISKLENDAAFIDSSVYKRTLKSTERVNQKVTEKLTFIGQNYFEYNMMEIRIGRFLMGLLLSKDEKEKNEMFAKMHNEIKMRTDNFYKDVNKIVMEALHQHHTPMARTYSQMGINPNQGQNQPTYTQSQPYNGSQRQSSVRQSQPYGTESQFGAGQSQFNGQY